jgi:hypothetical protein
VFPFQFDGGGAGVVFEVEFYIVAAKCGEWALTG